MMKNYKYIFLLLLTLISCEKKPTNNYGNKIIGEWIFEKENPKRKNYFYTDFSYSFDKIGNCESKPGYFDTKEKTEKYEKKNNLYDTIYLFDNKYFNSFSCNRFLHTST